MYPIQVAHNASTTGTPAAVTATLVATTKGSTLVGMVAQVGGTVTTPGTPTGCTVVDSGVGNGIGTLFFIYPNNPGGITSLASALSGSPTGAVMIVYEYGDLTLYPPQIAPSGVTTGTASATPNVGATPPLNSALFGVGIIVSIAATHSSGASTAWQRNTMNISSSGGTTNVTMSLWIGPLACNAVQNFAASFSASVAYVQCAYYLMSDMNAGGAACGGVVPNGVSAVGYCGALG